MKKNYNYDETERWARDGFACAEKHLKYSPKRDKESGEPEYERQSGVFKYVLAVAIVAIIVSAGTFGTLKYLEHIAGAHTVTPGAKVTYSEENIDEFVYITANGKTYIPQCRPTGVMKRTSSDTTETQLYDTALNYGSSKIRYDGGKLSLELYNNVKDREMRVTGSEVYKDGECEFRGYARISDLTDYLTAAPDGEYAVKIDVTWEAQPVNIGDKCRIYSVAFTVNKNAGSVPENTRGEETSVPAEVNEADISRSAPYTAFGMYDYGAGNFGEMYSDLPTVFGYDLTKRTFSKNSSLDKSIQVPSKRSVTIGDETFDCFYYSSEYYIEAKNGSLPDKETVMRISLSDDETVKDYLSTDLYKTSDEKYTFRFAACSDELIYFAPSYEVINEYNEQTKDLPLLTDEEAVIQAERIAKDVFGLDTEGYTATINHEYSDDPSHVPSDKYVVFWKQYGEYDYRGFTILADAAGNLRYYEAHIHRFTKPYAGETLPDEFLNPEPFPALTDEMLEKINESIEKWLAEHIDAERIGFNVGSHYGQSEIKVRRYGPSGTVCAYCARYMTCSKGEFGYTFYTVLPEDYQ